IGGILGDLGAARVHHNNGIATAYKGFIQARHNLFGPGTFGANYHSLGLAEIVYSGSFAQELRIRNHIKSYVRLLADYLPDAIGRAYGHSTFVDNNFVLFY